MKVSENHEPKELTFSLPMVLLPIVTVPWRDVFDNYIRHDNRKLADEARTAVPVGAES